MDTEENRGNIERLLRKGKEVQAPPELSVNVMSAWKEETRVRMVQAPLIRAWVWWLLGTSFSIIVLYSIFGSATPSADSFGFKRIFDYIQLPKLTGPGAMAIISLGVMMLVNIAVFHTRHFVRRG